MSEEIPGQPPDPTELAADLQLSVDKLVAAAAALVENPTYPGIGSVKRYAQCAKAGAADITGSRFFYEADSTTFIDMGLGAVIGSGKRLYQETGAITGKKPGIDGFGDKDHEMLIDAFLARDMSRLGIEGIGGQQPGAETSFEAESLEVADLVEEHFSRITDQYVEAALDAEKVREFIEQSRQEVFAIANKAHRRDERFRRSRLAGYLAVAKHAGNLLIGRRTPK